MPKETEYVYAYKQGDTTPRRFAKDTWNRMKKLTNGTKGWTELNPGASIPQTQARVPAMTAPAPKEIQEFPLKTRKEIESGLRDEISAEYQDKLDEKDKANQALRDQLAAIQSGKVPSPKSKEEAEKQSEAIQAEKAAGTEKAAGPEKPQAGQGVKQEPGKQTPAPQKTGGAQQAHADKSKAGDKAKGGS